MAIERRDPLPAGRYWLDVFPPNQKAWQTWAAAMKGIDSVTFEHTEHFDSVGGAPEHDFVIWSMTLPNVAYRAVGLPSPTIAESTVQSSADTVERPPPEPGALEQLQSAAAGAGTALKVGLGVGVGVAVVALAVSVFKR